MAPSDDTMEDPDPQDGAQKMALDHAKSHDTFHRYLHLPFELRAEIRAISIEAAIQDYIDFNGGDLEGGLPCSRLAVVSKEWQGDVEKALFGKIRLDPLNKGDVSKFEQYFTKIRKSYLTQFEVAVDDSLITGPRSTSFWDISQLMEKTGQLFQKLRSWDFSGDGGKQRSIAIMFTASDYVTGYHPGKEQDPGMNMWSLWDPESLSRFFTNGVPTNVVLWAIKSEFPSSLDMVTHLSLNSDIVPVAAAKRIVQVMPNLKSCTFETCFHLHVGEGWTDFTDFIHHLQASAPSLRELRLNGHGYGRFEDDVPAGMVEFANALRELSQRLELLHAWPFRLHEAFFLPFSQNADADADALGSHCNWPNLQHLVLRGFCELPTSGPGRATLTPSDIMIAAAKATSIMPKLTSMQISTPGRSKYVDFDPEHLEIGLAGFNEDEERTIIRAYAPSINAEAKLGHEDKCGEKAPFRLFKWST